MVSAIDSTRSMSIPLQQGVAQTSPASEKSCSLWAHETEAAEGKAPAWRKVVLHKRLENGELELGAWEYITREVQRENEVGEMVTVREIVLDEQGRRTWRYLVDNQGRQLPNEYHFIEETATGDLYTEEGQAVVASKCAALFLVGIPVYTAGKIVANILKIPADCVRVVRDALDAFVQDWKEKSLLSCCLNLVKRVCVDFVTSMARDIWHIVSAPIFALGCSLSALIGLVSPYLGRKLFTKVDHAWQDGITHKRDIGWLLALNVFACHPPYNEAYNKTLRNDPCKEQMHNTAAHIAYCFTKRHNLFKETNLVVVRREPISSDLWLDHKGD